MKITAAFLLSLPIWQGALKETSKPLSAPFFFIANHARHLRCPREDSLHSQVLDRGGSEAGGACLRCHCFCSHHWCDLCPFRSQLTFLPPLSLSRCLLIHLFGIANVLLILGGLLNLIPSIYISFCIGYNYLSTVFTSPGSFPSSSSSYPSPLFLLFHLHHPSSSFARSFFPLIRGNRSAPRQAFSLLQPLRE